MTQQTTASLMQNAWQFVGSVNLRVKVLGIVLGMVVLLGLAVTYQVRVALSEELEEQLKDQGVSITRDLAARATDLILINDMYALHQLLEETVLNNRNVRYAFIVDPEQHILAHTFGEGFPANLLEANSVEPDSHHHATWLETTEGSIWDSAVPIFGGKAGFARVGLSDDRMRHAVNTVTGQLLLTTVMVSAFGIAAATVLTWVLTHPILTLVSAAEAVAKGDLSPQVRRWANDEIGNLADAFNAMTEALRKAAQERAERDSLRAQYISGVIAAQEEERKRVARELHDGTGQLMTSLLAGLTALENTSTEPSVREHAGELRKLVSLTLKEVRNLAVQLRPSALDDLGLPAAIEHYLAFCSRHYDLQINLTIHGLDEGRLSTELETTIYRIVQEGLTNIARHAKATSVDVILKRRGKEVFVIIEDNGQGMVVNGHHKKADGGLGLYGIRERAELLGGKMSIESEPGRGTSLFVVLPLVQPVPAPLESLGAVPNTG